jgi:hypothetical protein
MCNYHKYLIDFVTLESSNILFNPNNIYIPQEFLQRKLPLSGLSMSFSWKLNMK